MAEPESSTRSTAQASGGPTYGKFQQWQTFFQYLIHDLLTIVISRYSLITAENLSGELEVHPGDLSGRDNVALAMAGSNLVGAFQTLYDLGGVSLEELVRVLYRFIGEEGDPKGIVSQGTGVDVRNSAHGWETGAIRVRKPNLKQAIKVDPDTGEIKDKNLQ